MAISQKYNFDQIVDRRAHNQIKWTLFDEDVLPLWVADMDYPLPDFIGDAIKATVDAGTFGYMMNDPDVRQTVVDRMQSRYGWTIAPEDILFVPGVVHGIGRITATFGTAGGGVLMQSPIYPPFLTQPAYNGLFAQPVDLIPVADGDNVFHYEIDFDAFEAAITPQTQLFYLCNPHNPAGRVFTESELTRLAEICLRHNVLIIADEIHSDLLFDNNRHIPIAKLSPEIAENTITLIAPSKTYNIPGLHMSFMIITDKAKREKMNAALWQSASFPSSVGFAASTAAYRHGDDWLKQVLAYMQANRDHFVQSVQDHMPQIKTTLPEGTYLNWLDCRALDLPDEMTPAEFFMKHARVAFNNGAEFGKAGRGFVRLNLATSHALLDDAIERMANAINAL